MSGPRVALLWPQMSGYVDACLRALLDQGSDIYLAYRAAQDDAPFDDDFLTCVKYRWEQAADPSRIIADLEEFKPDLILVASWHRPFYRKVLHHFDGRATRVLCMDNQWLGTAKQWGGRLISRFYVQTVYELAFVPGERQVDFARKLGFVEDEIFRGLNSANTSAFVEAGRAGHTRKPAFLYVGRLAREKNLPRLIEAYTRYRTVAGASAWELVITGTGPLAARLPARDGVRYLGFVQPAAMPELMARHSAFVLASTFEPWGVAAHEAAAAGMPLLLSSAAGSTPHLMREGGNGFCFEAGDIDDIQRALTSLAALPEEERLRMGEVSRGLALEYTPQRWAQSVLMMSKW